MQKITATLLLLVMLAAETAEAKRKHIPLDLATWHNNQGVGFLGKQQFDQAEVEFKTAVEVDPKYPEGHSNLGLIFKYRGDLEAAAKEFQTAIKLDPKWATPYNHLGTIYLSQKRYLKAIDYFKRAGALDKKFADAHYNLGVTYLEQAKETKNPKGDWQKARNALQAATTIDPRLYNAHLELANTYRLLGQTEKAILRYRLAIETNPNDSKPWERLADLYAQQGDDAKAEECLRQAKKLGPHSPEEDAETLLNLGDSYFQKKQYPQALKIYEQATQKKADFWQAHYAIGRTLEAMGDTRRAIMAYQAVLQINPKHDDSRSRLAKLERMLKMRGHTDGDMAPAPNQKP